MDRFLLYLKEYYDELSELEKKHIEQFINENHILTATLELQNRLKCGIKTSKCIIDFWEEIKNEKE